MIDIATSVRIALVNTRPHLPEITGETSLKRDLHCDGVDLVCIELALSDDFHVELPSCEFENCDTVADLAALVARVRRKAA